MLTENPRRFLVLGLAALGLFRFWFAAALPMTGDEAYFVLWGEHPAGGFYDHPPMVGWWLTGLLALSREAWVLRLPSIVLPVVLAACAWHLVRPAGVERARLAALLVLLQPVNVWNVLITTDTQVILFSMLSVSAYIEALRREAGGRAALLWHGVAGAMLGLAFLGKYFAALLGLAFVAHILFARRDGGRFGGFAVLLLAALPAPLYNLWWNSEHCWVNILFNFMNRHQGQGSGLSWQSPALYVVSLAYLATPWLIWGLWRNRKSWAGTSASRGDATVLLWLLALPLCSFALMSIGRPVGLHWMASFVPLFAAIGAFVLPLPLLVRYAKWSAVFAVAHIVVLLSIAVLPTQTWRHSKLYDGIVLTVHADEILRAGAFPDDRLLAMDGYSSAATLAYNAKRPVAVFGEGSRYARQDDFITDWRAQNGRDIVILRKSPPDRDEYAAYFDTVDVREFEVRGAHYWQVLGLGFNYPVYHDRVLARIRERFYRIPEGLPRRGCDFCARYFPDDKKQQGKQQG